VSILSLNSGNFDRTDELNDPLGSFSETDLALLLSASKAFSPRFSAGASLKVVRQSVEEFSATGVGGDFGLMYDLTPSLRVGASVLNVGGPNLSLRETQETFPVHYRAGMAARVLNGKGTLSGEIDQTDVTGLTMHVGAEYWLYSQVAVRFGYNDSSPSGGMSYRFPNGFEVRYALTDDEWTAIKPMLPNKPRGLPRVNDRRVLNGIFWVLRSGAPWRDLLGMRAQTTQAFCPRLRDPSVIRTSGIARFIVVPTSRLTLSRLRCLPASGSSLATTTQAAS
jgi:transposase